MKALNNSKLVNSLNNHPELKRAVVLIQKLNLKTDITETISSLNFPLGMHLFIMGNYSDLMSINFN